MKFYRLFIDYNMHILLIKIYNAPIPIVELTSELALILGVTIGSIVGVFAIVTIAYMICKKKQSNDKVYHGNPGRSIELVSNYKAWPHGKPVFF